jgi:hypothetical protein
MMKVMEKDSQPKGSFGLRHPERWSEDAVEFLSMTQVSTPAKLAQVSPFKRSITISDLCSINSWRTISSMGRSSD